MQKEIIYIRLKKRLPVKGLKIGPTLFQQIFVKTKKKKFCRKNHKIRLQLALLCTLLLCALTYVPI